MKVLVAFDGSPFAEAAIDDLPRAGLGTSGEIVALCAAEVSPPLDGTAPDLIDRIALTCLRESCRVPEALMQAKAVAEDGARRIGERMVGWKVQPQARLGHPAAVIVDAARASAANLIVVGSQHHRALARLLLGGVSGEIAAHAGCSVRIGRPRPAVNGGRLRIAVAIEAYDRAAPVMRAVDMRTWPAETELRLLLLPVCDHEPQKAPGDWAERAAEDLARRGFHMAATRLEESSPRALLYAAQLWGADCIFLGAADRHHGRESILSSFARSVFLHAHCSVEIVREPIVTPRGDYAGVSSAEHFDSGTRT